MSDQPGSPRRVSTAYILGFSKEPFKEPKMPRSKANFEAGVQPQTERQRPRRKSAIAEIFGTPGGLLEWSASDGRKGVLTGKGRHRLTSDRLDKVPDQQRTVQEALGQGGDAPAPNHTPHGPDKGGNAPNNTDDAGVDKWTIQQDRRLMQLKNENGNWRDIAVECGKTQAQCKARWKLIMPDGWDPKASRKHGNGDDNNTKEEEKAKDQQQKQGKNKQEKKKDQNAKKNESPKSNKGGAGSDAGIGGLFGGDLFGAGDDSNKNDTSGKVKDSSSNAGWGSADNKAADATTGWGNDAGNGTTDAAPAWGDSSNETTDATLAWGNTSNDTTEAAPAWGATSNENADAAPAWGATGKETTDASPAWGDTGNATTDAAAAWDSSGNGKDSSSNTGWQPEKTDAATGWNNSTDNPFLPKPTAKTTDSKKGKGTKEANGWNTGGDGNWGATSVKSAKNDETPAWADPDLNLPDGGGNDKTSSASWGTKKGSKKGDAKDKTEGQNDPWATPVAVPATGKGSAKANSTKGSPRRRSHHHRDSKRGSHRHSTKDDTPHNRDSKKDSHRRSHREETHRNDSGYVKLRPDETFDVDELCIIARILRQDTLDVWERLSYRFRDKTGRNIDPKVFEKKVNGYVEGEESDADSWKKG
ncbi:hypothetical protein IQ07DRAFT_271257 [Pyrenochaeta sp. DS3sAY3a]|nr:hypothetical protein IQ07DRAFT_271257 [Pyrenochaeta sp. DS3sAY3a]